MMRMAQKSREDRTKADSAEGEEGGAVAGCIGLVIIVAALIYWFFFR